MFHWTEPNKISKASGSVSCEAFIRDRNNNVTKSEYEYSLAFRCRGGFRPARSLRHWSGFGDSDNTHGPVIIIIIVILIINCIYNAPVPPKNELQALIPIGDKVLLKNINFL